MSQVSKSKAAAAAAAAGGIWRQGNQLLATLQSLVDTATNPSYPTCVLCNYEYRNQPVVRQHVLKSHLRGKNVDIDVDRKTCLPRSKSKEISSTTFPENMIVTWDFRGENNKTVYSCSKCDYAHDSKIRLSNHVRYLHSGKKKKGRPPLNSSSKNNNGSVVVTSPSPAKSVVPPPLQPANTPKKVFKRKRSSTFVENASTVVQENQLRRVLFSLVAPTNKLPKSTLCRICSFVHTKKMVRRHLMEVHLRGRNVHLENGEEEEEEEEEGSKKSVLLVPSKTRVKSRDPGCPVVHWILGDDVSVYSCKECDFTHPEESFVRDHSLHLAAEVLVIPEDEESLVNSSKRLSTTSNSSETATTTTTAPPPPPPPSVAEDSNGPPKVLYFAKKKVVTPVPTTPVPTNGDNSRCSTDSSSFFAERSLSSPPPSSSTSSRPPSTPTATTAASSSNSLAGLKVVKMGEYLAYGTREDFWEEREPKIVLHAVKNKEVDMKSAADLLGISYGALYRRYRKSFGKFNSPGGGAGGPEDNNGTSSLSSSPSKFPPNNKSFSTQNGGGNGNGISVSKKVVVPISISPFYRSLFTKNEVCMTCKLCRRIFPCTSSVRAHLKSFHRALSEEDDFEDEDDDETVVYHCEDEACTEHEKVVDEESGSNGAMITMYFDGDDDDSSSLNFTYAVQAPKEEVLTKYLEIAKEGEAVANSGAVSAAAVSSAEVAVDYY